MLLYHFTFARHLFPIFGWRCLDDDAQPVAEGIRPATDDVTDLMTNGVPVVWLTSRPSLMPTPGDLDWLNSPSCPLPSEGVADLRERGYIGDRTAMLTVTSTIYGPITGVGQRRQAIGAEQQAAAILRQVGCCAVTGSEARCHVAIGAHGLVALFRYHQRGSHRRPFVD
jgi:hypothetical protein